MGIVLSKGAIDNVMEDSAYQIEDDAIECKRDGGISCVYSDSMFFDPTCLILTSTSMFLSTRYARSLIPCLRRSITLIWIVG